MSAAYTIPDDSFHAEKPRPWSPGLFSIRGLANTGYDVHPDGSGSQFLGLQMRAYLRSN